MFKRIIFLLFSATLSLFLLASCSAKEKNPSLKEKDGLIFEPLNEDKSEYVLVKKTESKKEIIIPSEIDGKPVTAISYSVFEDDNTLEKITIPDSVNEIGNYAFNNCKELREVVFSSRIEKIGFKAFSGCEKIEEIFLPESLTHIESGAFSNCIALSKLHLNPLIETIGRDCFVGCDSISEIHVSDVAAFSGITFENIEANPIVNAEKLFVSGTHTENLTITGAETIREYAFFGFKGIKTLTLGEGVVNVNESAFSGCSSLKSLTLSDSVKTLGTSAFNNCSALEYVSVGGAEYFAGLAFYNCESIKTLEIRDLFAWCNAFFYTDSTGSANPMLYADTLTVNGEAVDTLRIPDGVEKISTLSFIGFKGSGVFLPSTLKVIEDTAFYKCDSLVNLHFDGSLGELNRLSIGYNNFEMVTKISYKG